MEPSPRVPYKKPDYKRKDTRKTKKKLSKGGPYKSSKYRTDGPDKKKDRKDNDKGEQTQIMHRVAQNGLSDCSSFSHAFALSLFSFLALSMIGKAGLIVAQAIEVLYKPIAGHTTFCMEAWHTITSDNWVLDTIRCGYKLQFDKGLPPTPHRVKNLPTDLAGTAVLDNEVEQMLAKHAIHSVNSTEDELVSCFFARPKKQKNKWRPIVSLKFLNKFLRYIKFKMTTISDVKLWIRKDHYFASIDLQDAYFSVSLNESAWKYVRFIWKNVTYEFKCIMFGLGASPRVFTKVIASIIKYLRLTFDMLIMAYLDDFLIQGPNYETCLLHLELAILTFQILGFEINFAKSNMIPSVEIEHLGFIWNSSTMKISLPKPKIDGIVTKAIEILNDGGCTADKLRSYLGKLESVRPVVLQASLHYRALQYLLQPHRKGPWRGQRFLPLSRGAKQDLQWWITDFPTLPHISAPLSRGCYTVEMKADASGSHGWGGHSSRGEFSQDVWSTREQSVHINRKEIWSGHYSLREMMQQGDYVLLSLDSKTAVSFINRMGGTR